VGFNQPWTFTELIDVLRAAIEQIPADRRDDLLITSDGAAASHPLIGWLDSLGPVPGRRVRYSVGFDVDEPVRAAANRRRDDCWLSCLSNTTGDLVDGLECTEITDLLKARLRDLDWPATMRSSYVAASCSTTSSPPCLIPTLTGTPASSPTPPPLARAGWVCSTRMPATGSRPGRRRRAHHPGHRSGPATVEVLDRKQGLLAAVTIAVDLIAWLRLYALTGALAKAGPKTLATGSRTPARLVHARRYRWLRLPRAWPWATPLATAIDTIRRMPMPAT
jgi:hypothetical protein